MSGNLIILKIRPLKRPFPCVDSAFCLGVLKMFITFERNQIKENPTRFFSLWDPEETSQPLSNETDINPFKMTQLKSYLFWSLL